MIAQSRHDLFECLFFSLLDYALIVKYHIFLREFAALYRRVANTLRTVAEKVGLFKLMLCPLES